MVEGELFMGIDVGTTNAKCMVFNDKGEVVASATREYPTYFPKPGWVEQDPEDWWRAVVEAVRECVNKFKGGKIGGIGVSSQREGVVLLDKSGKPLGRVMIWMDRRSLPQAERIKQEYDIREIYRRTGVIVDPTFTATKLLWLKENEPELLRKAGVLLQAKDYIIYKLTGAKVTDYSIASRTMLLDVIKREWAYDLFEEWDLPQDKFPELKYSDEIVGEVSEEASAETGLAKGIPVVAGGGDRSCETLGAGILDSSIVEESTGTGSTTATTLDKPLFDPKMRVIITCHVIKGKWGLEVGISTAGAILRWFRDNLGLPEKLASAIMRRRAYELMDMEAEYVPPGSHGLLLVPFFMGARAPRWKPEARGVLFGLTLYHSRAHIARAIMEGVAYELRKVMEVLKELGIEVKELRALGGGGKTPLWAKIKADVIKVKVSIPKVLDAACLGGAILASLGTGYFKDVRDAVNNMVSIERNFETNPENSKIYDKLYNIYNKLIDSVSPLFKELSEFAKVEPRPVEWDVEKLIHLLYRLETY